MKPGRPTKLTPEVQEIIVRHLEIGCTRKDSALAAGVSVDSFLAWLKRGQQDRAAGKRTKFSEFLGAVEQAEARARARYTAVIARAAQSGDWRAALEFLRRRDREHWGDRQAVDVSMPEPPKVIIEIVDKRGRGADSAEL